MAKKPHVIVVTYPAQGHVIPMLEFSQWLVKYGVRVTFVNTEFSHKTILKSLSESDNIQEVVNMVPIRDGLKPWEDRNDLRRITESIFSVPPVELESLIIKINKENGDDKIACVIADGAMAWALEVAGKLGIRRAAFWTAPAANQMIQLSPNMPLMNSTDFIWACVGDEATQKVLFDAMIRSNSSIKSADWIICNSSYDLETGAFSLFPNFLSIGPLLASNRLGKSAGYFLPVDSTCLAWLDQQPTSSVIYVSFGTSTILDQTQFEEVALGLELTNRPFLWVVRTIDVDDVYPKGFKDRVQNRGRMVNWAPQQQVLSHPSVACFISHCGWNSTIEGIANGVPFICWPYYADQLLNQTYICDEWKVGLGLSKDENGIIRREELKDQLENLLTDKSYKERALSLREKVMDSVKEGSSYKNFNKLIDWINDN
ncbi:hypothetical protein DH2020_037104 [Rehmannia glutinosa]|uniref:UDP-glycosyltransferase n=1 Tax=Rehmannia glutinosa TaxID=99300 RepID=A0ABR0V2Z2_REHGL